MTAADNFIRGVHCSRPGADEEARTQGEHGSILYPTKNTAAACKAETDDSKVLRSSQRGARGEKWNLVLLRISDYRGLFPPYSCTRSPRECCRKLRRKKGKKTRCSTPQPHRCRHALQRLRSLLNISPKMKRMSLTRWICFGSQDSQRPSPCPFQREKNIGGTFVSGNAVVVSFFSFFERGKQRFSCLCSHALLIAATDCTIRLRLLLLLFLLVFVTGVLLGWDPETRLTAGRVLAGKVVVDTAGHG